MIDWRLVISISWRVSLVIVVLVVMAIAFMANWRERRAIRVYVRRGSAKWEWRRVFGDDESQKIRRFLDIFAETFTMAPKEAECMRPEDRLMDFYNEIQPWPACDSLRLVHFAMELETKYGVESEKVFSPDVTLGQVFSAATGVAPRRSHSRFE